MHTIETEASSLLKSVSYDSTKFQLSITFADNYFKRGATYVDFTPLDFMNLSGAQSQGSYYLKHIRGKFVELKRKKMNYTRFCRMSLNLDKVNADWLFQGEKGLYLNATWKMKAVPKAGKFADNGMIIQDVSKEIYLAEKDITEWKDKTQTPILGNGILYGANLHKEVDRIISLSINMDAIIKENITPAKNGVRYLNLSLQLDSSAGGYDSGKLLQDVAREVYEQEKSFAFEDRTPGNEVGNAKIKWSADGKGVIPFGHKPADAGAYVPRDHSGEPEPEFHASEEVDDLPF